MNSDFEPVTVQPLTETDQNERRWQPGSFVALGYALLMGLFNIGLIVYTVTLPTDGWYLTTPRGSSSETFEIGFEFAPIGAPLQAGDQVVAVNGEPVSIIADRAFAFYDLTPPNWPDGTILTYDIRRGGGSLRVDVPIRRLTAREYLTVMRGADVDSFFEWLIGVAGPLSFFVIGLTVFLLRPGSRAAHALFLIGIAFFFNLLPVYDGVPTAFYPFPPSSIPFDSWTAVINPSLMYLVLVFPQPKWLLRRFPRGGVVLLYLPWLLIFNIAYLLHLNDRVGYYGTAQTLYIVQVVLLMVVTLAGLAHTALTVRDPVSRSQFKWLALGLIGFVIVGVGGWLVLFLSGNENSVLARLAQAFGRLGWFLLPITVAIAITRYRLFDIDILIRRTTSYAIVTALLALVYFGSIVVLQRLITPITGESDVAVVLSTLLIAALFLPVRRRVQDVIDRRFNRTRYDAEKTLERFAATLRDETDLDALTAELLRIIQETMQPETLSIWLRDPADEGQNGDKVQFQESGGTREQTV
jgi:hypothetical protein